MIRPRSSLSLALGILALGSSALAEERTIRLSVPGMYCASCPYIVEQAILAVDGVKTAKANHDDRTAIVTFDDQLAKAAQIMAATARYGYPSQVVGPDG